MQQMQAGRMSQHAKSAPPIGMDSSSIEDLLDELS